MSRKRSDCAPDAFYGERQEPRAPYCPDGLDALPMLPKHCPRCAAELFPCEIEIELIYSAGVKCIICAWLADRQMIFNRLKQELKQEMER